MAERIAELERECSAIRECAMRARGGLAEANRTRRQALAILRHLRDCPADGDARAPAFARLWRQAEAGRRRAFDAVREHRPAARVHAPDADRVATPAECHADAWRDGWDCGL